MTGKYILQLVDLDEGLAGRRSAGRLPVAVAVGAARSRHRGATGVIAGARRLRGRAAARRRTGRPSSAGVTPGSCRGAVRTSTQQAAQWSGRLELEGRVLAGRLVRRSTGSAARTGSPAARR